MDPIAFTPTLTSEEVLTSLKQFITEVIGEEFVNDLDITLESSFTKDLEMDSIELVAFAEKVKLRFGEHVDFTGWLSGMNIDQLINLRVSQVVNYIQYAGNSGQ